MNRRIITINISVSIICSSSSIVKFWLCVFMSRVSRNCSFKIRRMKSQTLILIVRISRSFRCVSVYGISRNVCQTYRCTQIFSGLRPLFLNLVFEKFILTRRGTFGPIRTNGSLRLKKHIRRTRSSKNAMMTIT